MLHRPPANLSRLFRMVCALVLAAALLPDVYAARAEPLPETAEFGFTVPEQLPYGATGGAAAWGDYDNDGDLDAVINGIGTNEVPVSLLLQNNDGKLEQVPSGLPGVESSSLAWGDFDRDGDLDLLVTGQTGFSAGQVQSISRVYVNDGGVFSDLEAGLPGVYRGAGEWADFDNDGDLDILITGYSAGNQPITRLYRNNLCAAGMCGEQPDPFFSEVNAGLPGLGDSSAAWGDVDLDGDMDLVLIGKDAPGAEGSPHAHLFRNDAVKFAARPPYDDNLESDLMVGVIIRNNILSGAVWDGSDEAPGPDGCECSPLFTEMPAGLPALWEGSASWADVDGDGDLDLLLAGNTAPGLDRSPLTRFFRNQGLTDEGQLILDDLGGSGLPDLWHTALSWADFDNDGDIDLLINGLAADQQVTGVYQNDGSGLFTDFGAGLPVGFEIIPAWGDVNNDLTLDLLLTGLELETPDESKHYYRTLVFTTVIGPKNTPPAPPESLTACWDGTNTLALEWSGAADAETPPDLLTYNLRFGSGPDSGSIIRDESDLLTGARLVTGAGTNLLRRGPVLLGLPWGMYSWSVQAVDGAFAAGPFSQPAEIPLGLVLAYQDYAQTGKSMPVLIDVLANDDTRQGELTIHRVSTPYNGQVAVQDGQVLYTPNPDFHGYDSFTYAVRSPSGYCTLAKAVVKVEKKGQPPCLNPIPDQFLTWRFGENTVQLTDLFSGEPGGPLTITATTDNPDLIQQITIRLLPDGTVEVNFNLPPEAVTGEATIILSVEDGLEDSSEPVQTEFKVYIEDAAQPVEPEPGEPDHTLFLPAVGK